MDKCEGCQFGDVDLSQGAFQSIADLDQGRVSISTQVVDCSLLQASSPPPTPPQPIQSAPPPAEDKALLVSPPPKPKATLILIPVTQKNLKKLSKNSNTPIINGAQRCGAQFNGSSCADSSFCCSKWGYCGVSENYCSGECQNGPCK